MKLEDWLSIYYEIVKDFGISSEKDDESARLMHQLGKDKLVDVSTLREKIAGKNIAVVGYAVQREELEAIKSKEETAITAGKALLKVRGIDPQFKPHIHVTDMEERELLLEIKNDCLLVLHAHGDNMGMIKTIVPKIPSFTGTTQFKPFDRVYNFGGFTDGDRAALLAQEMGAAKITLYGFDFKSADGSKAKKLRWAEKVLRKAEII